ncbi:unnamed protein product [Merluccius merluccius]
MATYGDDSVDSSSSYFYPSYNPCAGRCHRPRAVAWRYRKCVSDAHADADADAAAAAEAFNNHQRAQLRSIISQINPKLTPRLRKANTRDVAVQVNPRADASVQCAIGHRTLALSKLEALCRRRARECAQGAKKCAGSSGGGVGGGGGTVRYPRTLAVYSPIAYRSITSFLSAEEEDGDGGGGSCDVASGEEPLLESDAPKDESDAPKDENNNNDDGGGSDVRVAGVEPKAAAAAQLRKVQSKKPLKAEASEPVKEGSKIKARVRFQFLEQKYGYYHCRGCNLRWESAYVWCVQGTNKVYFKQFCRKCQKEFNPYRVEDIRCHTCNKARCSCALTQRHVDPKRPHRQDLCGRCKGKRLSCDSTFSFKYII